MTLLAFEGFEGLDQNTELAAKGWIGSVLSNVGTTNVRTGLRSASSASSAQYMQFQCTAPQMHETLIVGGAWYSTNPLNDSLYYFWGDNGATHHITIKATSVGSVEVWRGNQTTLLGTSTLAGLFPAPGYNYIEAKVTLSDTVGEVTVRVNNREVISLTNIDTKNGGTNTVLDRVRWHPGISGTVYYDDLYICNGAGSINNDFLGECRVRPIRPSGNGNTSDLVGSDSNSTDNYLLIDETGAIRLGTADYVGSDVVDAKDTYIYENLPDTTGEIKGVCANSYAQKTDSALRSIVHVVRHSGSEADSDDKALSTSFGFYSSIWEQNPVTTTDWTISDVNNAEFGVKVH